MTLEEKIGQLFINMGSSTEEEYLKNKNIIDLKSLPSDLKEELNKIIETLKPSVNGEYQFTDVLDIISQKEVTKNDNFLSHSERLDIVDLIKKYHSATIYPLPLLNDFIENDFRSIEERRYDEQLCRTNLSIIVAALAIIIPLVYEKYCSDNVTTYDAQEIATAIKELKTTELDSITQQFDTLEIKVLAPYDKASFRLPNTCVSFLKPTWLPIINI